MPWYWFSNVLLYLSIELEHCHLFGMTQFLGWHVGFAAKAQRTDTHIQWNTLLLVRNHFEWADGIGGLSEPHAPSNSGVGDKKPWNRNTNIYIVASCFWEKKRIKITFDGGVSRSLAPLPFRLSLFGRPPPFSRTACACIAYHIGVNWISIFIIQIVFFLLSCFAFGIQLALARCALCVRRSHSALIWFDLC